jgi:hypothetical protein
VAVFGFLFSFFRLLLCTRKEVTRSLQASESSALALTLVIPAKAGIQLSSQSDEVLDPGFRRDDEQETKSRIQAFAGMTSE